MLVAEIWSELPKEGDKNSRFLHQMAAMMSRVSFLGRLRRVDTILESPTEIKDEVVRFFEDLYKSENVVKPSLDSVSFPTLPSDVQIWLEKEFEEEVSRALEECRGDKAPSLDGFNFSTLKQVGSF